MSRGSKIIILAVACLAAIGAIFYFIIWPLFPHGAAPSPAANANANKALPAANANSNANANVATNAPLPKEVTDQVQQASAARSIVRTFAEKLGTYTNRNGLANLADLQSISTPAVWKYIDGEYRAGLIKSMPVGQGNYSVVSTAMSVNLAPSADDAMAGKVSLQRTESGLAESVSYKTLDIKLKKGNDGWIVSWLEWEK